MTGSSLASRSLAGLVLLLLLAGVAAANSNSDGVAIRADSLDADTGAVDDLKDTAEDDPLAEDAEEASTLDQIGDALSSAGEAIADAAKAAAGAIGDGAVAIGSALATIGGALADATVWLGQGTWAGIVAIGDGLAWLGLGAVDGAVWLGSALADGTLWLGSTVGAGAAWLAHRLADGAAWSAAALAGLATGLFDSIAAAWPTEPRNQAIVAGGAAGTTAAAGGLAWYARAGRLLKYAPFLAPLYSRIQPDELLEHPVRQRIYDAIEANPGVHLSGLARDLDVSWGTLLHHLNKLEDGELIVSDSASGKRCFFLPGQVSSEKRTILPALENEKARKIAEFYARHPGASQAKAAETLGYSAALVSWHLKRLEEAGVVTRERVGRRQQVGITQEAMAVVA